MQLVCPNLELPESRHREKTRMLVVYVGGDPGEQGRESREDETGKEDKPIKGVLLSLFCCGSVLLGTH